MITAPLRTKHRHIFYRCLVGLRILISLHVAYIYAMFSSESQKSKWGTFIEGTDHTINYLPYITVNDNDTFYQSLIFQWCLYPTYSGNTIIYREELCHVTTSDYQTFTVSVQPEKFRADGTTVTLNDIYFTYQKILKDNYRNIASLDTYRNIRVEVDGNTVKVVFPASSVDNMIFFTNFILPAHLLANKSLETYIDTFYKRPIGTNCAVLQPSSNDPSSVVFDLNTCENTLLRFYQVKQFPSTQELESYVESNPDMLDMIISDHAFTGYNENKVILNKYVTLFFNTKRPSLTASLRQRLAKTFHRSVSGSSLDTIIVQDPYIFDTLPETIPTISSGDFNPLQSPLQDIVTTTNTLKALPESISRGTTWETKEYRVSSEITDKFPIEMKFTETYDRVSVSFNQGVEYFPESFNAETQTTFYNLNPLYRNVVQGRNQYTIKAYQWNTHVQTFTLIVHYLSEPTTPREEDTVTERSIQPFTVVYFHDAISTAVASYMTALFERLWVGEYFIFESFDDADSFEGKLTSQDYDIAIRTITMGLRKDLSNLFASSVPTLNPSLYVNEELNSAINTYFLRTTNARNEAKQRINEIYNQDVPLVMLGKELGSINLKDDLSFEYPFRLYVFGRRKDFLQDITMFQHVSIDRDAVVKRENMIRFFDQYR